MIKLKKDNVSLLKGIVDSDFLILNKNVKQKISFFKIKFKHKRFKNKLFRFF